MEEDAPPTEESFGSWAGSSIPEGSAKLELLAQVVENSPAGIFVKDPDGTFLYVNAAYLDLDTKPLDQIIGKKDVDIYPDVDPEELRGDDLLAMNAPGPFERTQHVRMRGEERIFRTVKFPVHGSDDKLVGVCGISLDVTDTLLGEIAEEAERARAIASKPFERLVATLTPQEGRVADLLLLGFSDKQIADTLHLTQNTVRHHVSHILKKLRKRSRTQAVIALMLNRKDRD